MFAIICDARGGLEMGIKDLALVDRTKERGLFWTSDSPGIMKRFKNKDEAEKALKRLKYNNPSVISASSAIDMLNEQRRSIEHDMAQTESERGWDAHK